MIGSRLGDIVLLSLEKLDAVVLVRATLSVRDRVWKSLWINEDMFLTSSTYGVINVFKRESENKWNLTALSGHSDSVFAMGKSEAGLLATGDYRGNIVIWALKDKKYNVVQRLKIDDSVEEIVWHNNDVFAAMNHWGKMFLFERSSDESEWKPVIEVKNATSMGTSINMTEDGKTIFGGSNREVIQFDVETQQVDSVETPQVRRIFTKGNTVFVLTPDSLLSFERRTIEVRRDLIKYKYVKIGVVGHTGAGKSALCSYLTTGSPGDQTSTVGKRVWGLGLPPEAGLDRRMTFHDYGGQETVLCTFLPFLSDSNIILILFKQTDLVSFRKALELLYLLRSNIPQEVRIFFVQTFIDAKVAELNDKTIQELKDEGKIIDNLLVSSKDGRGIEELKARLIGDEAWGRARTMVQTTYTDEVLQTIVTLQERNVQTISLQAFAEYYENRTGKRIPKYHLKFLLSDYSNQGVIEYYPEALDLIIFNEPKYNSLKTELPIYVMKRNGIVSMKDVQEQFKNSRFIPVIDTLYLRYRIAIENFEKRIFPSLLSEKPIEIPTSVKNLFGDENIERRLLSDQSFDIERLIALLSEFKLQCIYASKSDGLFSYGENAVIYYRFERIGDAFNGFFLQCSFRVGGKNKQVYQRLKSDFVSIVELLHGAFLKEPESQDKKNLNQRGNEYTTLLCRTQVNKNNTLSKWPVFSPVTGYACSLTSFIKTNCGERTSRNTSWMYTIGKRDTA